MSLSPQIYLYDGKLQVIKKEYKETRMKTSYKTHTSKNLHWLFLW